MRGVGIVELEPAADVPVCLYADLDRAPERLPEAGDDPAGGRGHPVRRARGA